MFDGTLESENSNGARKLLARHNASMMAVLELVADFGIATVPKSQVVRWYGQERLSRGIWRDVEEKWREELDEEAALLVADSDGILLFVYGDGLTSSKDAWFQPVSALAKSTD